MDWKSHRISALLAASCLSMVCPAVCPAAFSQDNPTPGATQAATPAFDVATIKPHPPTGGTMDWMGIRNSPNGIDAAFVTLTMLVQRAYGLLTTDQVSGCPEWAKAVRFDIQAKMSEADIAETQKLSAAEIKERRERMMQALLAERFQLRVHSETKQVPVYELVVAKGGPKMKDAATDTSDRLEKEKDGKPKDGLMQPEGDRTVAQGESMKALANFLSQPIWSGLERPVVDKTGLTGTYNFTLSWSPNLRSLPGESSRAASLEESDPIFTALREVGLRLQPSTGPLKTFVIDHVERPTAN